MFNQNNTLIKSYRDQLIANADKKTDGLKRDRLTIMVSILDEMIQNPERWDKCTFNIQNMGQKFLAHIANGISPEDGNVNELYPIVYRFFCEFELIGEDLSSGNSFEKIHSFIYEDVHCGPSDDELIRKIRFAAYEMPARITIRMMRSDLFEKIYNLDKTTENIKRIREELDKDICRHKKEADELSKKLISQKTGMNFALLHKGFSNIYKRKEREEWFLRGSLIAMAITLLIPLLLGLIITLKAAESNFQWSHLAHIIPIVPIELILIYFFRILLVNHKSTRTQMLQIELRASLCEFIEHYAEFAKKAKEKDGSSLEKFESLIFSNILADSESMPSTFDGIDQIGKIIQNFKNK